MCFAFSCRMKQEPKFDSLMAQLSQQAEQQRTDEEVERARLEKRNRILSRLGLGAGVLLCANAIYYRAELRAYLLPHAANTAASGNATGTAASRDEKLKKTVTDTQEQVAYVDNIMDNVPDKELGKVHAATGTNAAELAAVNGRGSLKTAMQNAKSHAALVDSIMDGKTPPAAAAIPAGKTSPTNVVALITH